MQKITYQGLAAALLIGSFAMIVNGAPKQSMQCSQSEMKKMDSNKDSMISKDEFLTYQEQAFDKMKQTDGMVSLKDSKSKSNADSLNSKPMGTVTDNPEVNTRDAVNGKSY